MNEDLLFPCLSSVSISIFYLFNSRVSLFIFYQSHHIILIPHTMFVCEYKGTMIKKGNKNANNLWESIKDAHN